MIIGASSGSSFFLLIIVAFAFLWFILVRPQKRRQNDQQRMLDALQVGDEVLTAGGIYGEITAIEGDDVLVRIAPSIEVKVARRAIGGVVVPPGPGEAEEAGETVEPDEYEEPEEPAEPAPRPPADG